MTETSTTSIREPGRMRSSAPPSRFGLLLLAAVGVPTALLFLVPQPVLAPLGLALVLLCVLGGGAAVGGAVAAVLRSASPKEGSGRPDGARVYLIAAGFCFFTLCMAAPAAVLVATGAWYGFNSIDSRAVLMTAVAGGVLVLSAVAAVSGAVLLFTRGVRPRTSWAKVDFAVQVFGLGALFATVAVLY